MYSFDSRLAWANAYASLGFQLFPCHTLEDKACSCGNSSCSNVAKHPLTEHGVKDATSNLETLALFFSGDYSIANIALATGAPSKVFVLDVDDAKALASLEYQHSPLPKTWTVETGSGGRHCYFRFSEELHDIKNAVKFSGALDIRTTGGYVILPPSIHRSGKVYQWLVAPNDCAIATVPTWLVTLIRKHTQTYTDIHERLSDIPISRHPSTHDILSTSTVENNSKNLANETNAHASNIVKPNSLSESSNSTVDERDSYLRVSDSPDNVERIKRYLSLCSPAISGNGGQNVTFKLCCYLVRSFDNQSDNVLVSAMSDWNSRCVPPWTEHELRRKLSDARERIALNDNQLIIKIENDIAVKTVAEQSNPVANVEKAGYRDVIDVHESTPKNIVNNDTHPSLHAHAFHGILGQIVKAIEPQTEADVAGVLVTLLTAYGNACGKLPSFFVNGSTHHANLFISLSGDTASGKGLAMDCVSYIMRLIDSDWQQSIAYGLSSGEGLIERVADEQPSDDDKSKSKMLYVKPIARKRILCLETEASKPITAMRREGNTLSGVLRSAWDGQTLEVMTRGKTSLRASDAYISVVFHVTPKELRKLLANSVETFNGFANRFLWVSVRSSKDLPNGGNLSVVDSLLPLLKQKLAKAKAIGTMQRSIEAEKLWESVYPSLKRSEITATERARAQVLRLAMIYALADGIATIDSQHITAALAVWRYCEDSALMIFDAGGSLALKIRSLVRETPGIKRSELRDKVSHSTPTESFDTAISWLIEHKHVYCVKETSPRVCERYYPTSPMDNQIEKRVAYMPEQESPLSLADLLDWKTTNRIKLVRRPTDSLIWVSPDNEQLLTPAISQSLIVHQETLAMLVCPVESYSDVTIEDVIEDDDWTRELAAVLEDDSPAVPLTQRLAHDADGRLKLDR